MPNIMREFKIAELSCVDRPAQKEAKAVLMKRYTEEDDMRVEKIASFDTFEDAVTAIAKAENLPEHAAMSRVARVYPGLVKSYNAKALERVTPPKLPPGSDEFEGAVHSIQQRDRVDRATAMSRARKEHPEAYAAYQRA